MKLKKILFSFSLFTFFFLNFVITSNAAGWGFRKNSNHETPHIGRYQELIDGTDSFYVGDESKKEVILTFDAGYDNGNLSIILDTLKEKKVIASFFITGDFVKRFPELVLRMTADGHIMCNHSYSHKRIQNLSKMELKNDLEKLENAYFNLTKKQMVSYFRPPEGEFTKQALQNVKDLGYKTVFWSIAYKDWDASNQVNIEKAKCSILDNLHPGAIILLHSVSKSNAIALSSIIDGIINEGYTFKTVLDL